MVHLGNIVPNVQKVDKNHYEEFNKLNRCIICNSTEDNDTFERDGIHAPPIDYWVVNVSDQSYMCNRCHDSVKESLEEMEDSKDE